MKEEVLNAIWAMGVRIRDFAKHYGWLGRLESALLRASPILLRPPVRETEVKLPFGVTLTVPAGYPAARTLAGGLYEVDVTRLFKRLVSEGMTVVDLGANIGYYTLIASCLVGPSGRVYAFEPDPRNYAYLLRNVRANACANVIAVEKAVSNSIGAATFVPDERGAEGRLSAADHNTHSILVQTVTLDDFFSGEGWPPIDLVKMDIEGGEGAALEGMRRLSDRNPRMKLLMEYNPRAIARAGGDHQRLSSLLEGLGYYQGYIIEQHSKPFHINTHILRSGATYDLLLTKQEHTRV